MIESFELLYTHAIRLPTLPYSILLGVVILFWFSVILGALDIETFDFDVDTDVDIDVDLDMDADADVGDAGGLGSFWASLNLGVVPVSLWISIFVIIIWLTSIMLNGILDAIFPVHNLFRLVGGFIILAPLTAILTKYAVLPFKPVFNTVKEKGKKDFVREVCEITTSKVTPGFGMAEIKNAGAVINIDVRARTEEGLTKNDRALILSYDKDEDVFQVTRFEHERITSLSNDKK